MTTEIKNLMFDLSAGREIFDAEADRVISKAEANEVLKTFCREELGLSEKASHRDIKRALDTPAGKELFQIIEEIIDYRIATGWKDNEFFNQFVEMKNIADGDQNEFWTDQDVILTVAKVAGDHHDLKFGRVCVA